IATKNFYEPRLTCFYAVIDNNKIKSQVIILGFFRPLFCLLLKPYTYFNKIKSQVIILGFFMSLA
ncbi:MAG: hypothetical protein J6R88_02795, partial [Clostridia bacterium]|nr:hypothetical protein [Clostridia bacterium]